MNSPLDYVFLAKTFSFPLSPSTPMGDFQLKTNNSAMRDIFANTVIDLVFAFMSDIIRFLVVLTK